MMTALGPPSRILMLFGIVSTGVSIVTGLLRGESPSVGWFVAGLGLFFAGRIVERFSGK